MLVGQGHGLANSKWRGGKKSGGKTAAPDGRLIALGQDLAGHLGRRWRVDQPKAADEGSGICKIFLEERCAFEWPC
jgi:hypothetical protein